jgi:hypothetical protein
MTGAKPKNSTHEVIIAQAKSGSIAAIIQLLNESLAHLNVRTRAVLQGRVLQLLCEAEASEQLETKALVSHIQELLEAIAPPNFGRVKIYSRIVREQQLLWLEEITRDPVNQVLWSEEIRLKRPNFFKRLRENWNAKQAAGRSISLSQDFPSRPHRKTAWATGQQPILFG